MCELPWAVEWKRQAPRVWSVLTALPETSIFKQAAVHDLAAAQQSNIPNWAAGLLACAKQHGMALTGADGSMMAAAERAPSQPRRLPRPRWSSGVCGHQPEDSAVRWPEADDIPSMVFAPWLGSASSGSWSSRRRSCALFRGSAWDRARCPGRWRPAGLQR